MQTSKPRPKNLSLNQRIIWNYVTSSEHPLRTISTRSGYSEQGIKNWMAGLFEPPQLTVDNITATITILKAETPSSINWQLKKRELIKLNAQSKTNRQIAEIMGTTIPAIENAKFRFCSAI
jgi:hypothetical protein